MAWRLELSPRREWGYVRQTRKGWICRDASSTIRLCLSVTPLSL